MVATQRRVLQPFEERVRSRLRALAWGIRGKAVTAPPPQPSSAAPSPLLLGPSGISQSLPWPNRASALGSHGGRGLGSGPGSPSLYFPLPLSPRCGLKLDSNKTLGARMAGGETRPL